VEPDVVPATEKNWEEIWRQTWGSEAVRKLVPDAAVEGPSDDSARPIDLAVLETWETPVEESGPPGEAREVPDIAAELPESSTVTPGGHEAEDPDPVSEAAADSVDNDASAADGSDLDSLDTTDDSPIPNAGSLNGSEPDSDWEPSVEPADLTDTPSRDHR
jgi:hypothetical protein